MMSILNTAWQMAPAYVLFAVLMIDVHLVHSVTLCEDNSLRISNVGETGTIYTDLSTNDGNFDNPCIMKIETCSTCQIEINAVHDKDFDFFCKTGVLQNSYCSLGCDYLHIFDMYYMNETRTAPYYKNWSDFTQPFVSESSNIFIMLCHGLTGRYKFSLTYNTIRKLTEKTGTYTDPNLQHGTILSPFFPRGYYLNHEVYQYVIKGLQDQDRILLIFDDWHLDSSSALYYEDGSNEGSYTGASLRPSIVTDTNTLRFVFHTGDALSPTYGRKHMGFKASYSFHSSLSIIQKPVTNCKGSGYFMNQVGGYLEFSYSNVQTQLYDCVWVVKRQSGYTGIYLKITSMRMLGYGKSGYMVVRAGLTSDSRVVGNISLADDIKNVLPFHEADGFYIRLTAKLSSSDKVELAYASFRDTTACHREAGMFECDSRRCISQTLTCDGYDHCGDNSDEDKACGVYTPAWDQSYQYTITIGVIVPMVISVFLVMVICLLFVLIRRCRRQRMEDTRSADRIRTLSEDVSPTREPGQRRRRRRRRRLFNTATDRDNPPTYDEAIQSPPSWYLNVGFSNPADPNSPQPPPYSEVGDAQPAILTNQVPGSPTSSHSSQSEVTIDSRRHSVSSSSSDGGFRGWNDHENNMEGRRGRLGRHVSSSDDSEDEPPTDTRIPQRLTLTSNFNDLDIAQTGTSSNVSDSHGSPENSTKQKGKGRRSGDVDTDTTVNDKDKPIKSGDLDVSVDGQIKLGTDLKQGSSADIGARKDLDQRSEGVQRSDRIVPGSINSNVHSTVSSARDNKPTKPTHAGVSSIEMNRLDNNVGNVTRPSLSNQRRMSRSVGSLLQNQGSSLTELRNGTRRSLAAQPLPEDDVSLNFVVDVDTNEVRVVNNAPSDYGSARPHEASPRTHNSTRPHEASPRTYNSTRPNEASHGTNYSRRPNETQHNRDGHSRSPHGTPERRNYDTRMSPHRYHEPDTDRRRSDKGHNNNDNNSRPMSRERLPVDNAGTQQEQPLGRVTSVNYIPLFIEGNQEEDIYV